MKTRGAEFSELFLVLDNNVSEMFLKSRYKQIMTYVQTFTWIGCEWILSKPYIPYGNLSIMYLLYLCVML
jgi:hypothetical protein